MPEKDNTTATLLGEIEQGPSKFEQFLDKNQKLLIAIAIALVVVVAGYIVLSGMNKSKGQAAAAALAKAQTSEDYRSVIASHSGSKAAGSARILLANNLWDEGSQEEAVSELKTFLSEDSDHPAYPVALINISGKLATIGKHDDAIRYLKEVKEYPEGGFSEVADLLTAIDSYRRGENDAAIEILEELQQQGEKMGQNRSQVSVIAEQYLEYLKSPVPEVVEPEAIPEKNQTNDASESE